MVLERHLQELLMAEQVSLPQCLFVNQPLESVESFEDLEILSVFGTEVKLLVPLGQFGFLEIGVLLVI